MKTYACKVRDYVGAVYTVGFFLSSSPAEALTRARREVSPEAWAEETSTENEMIKTIDDLVTAENELTSKRIHGGI